MTTLVRSVAFRPAFDKRDPNPNKSYGVHGVDMTFMLVNAEAKDGLTFTVFTNWHLPHVHAEWDAQGKTSSVLSRPMGADVSIHRPKNPYPDEDTYCHHGCKITGGDCYSDGSGLLAETLLEMLIAQGEDAMWTKMEEIYNNWK